MSTRSQRGRVAKKNKRGSSIGIFYVVLAIIAIAGVALLATVSQRPGADTSGRPSNTTTKPHDSLPARGKHCCLLFRGPASPRGNAITGRGYVNS